MAKRNRRVVDDPPQDSIFFSAWKRAALYVDDLTITILARS